jgi:hypothetical protein
LSHAGSTLSPAVDEYSGRIPAGRRDTPRTNGSPILQEIRERDFKSTQKKFGRKALIIERVLCNSAPSGGQCLLRQCWKLATVRHDAASEELGTHRKSRLNSRTRVSVCGCVFMGQWYGTAR